MTDFPPGASRLGSDSQARRILNVIGVSLYLAAAWVVLVITFRMRLDLPAIAAYLRRRGRIEPTAAGPPTGAPPPDPTALAPEREGPFDLGEWTELFCCPSCRTPISKRGEELVCEGGHGFPIVRGVPRFVATDAYVRSFSREWNTHDRTQLDSQRGEPLSAETLRTKTGLERPDVEDKLVLDAGIGSGRFSEVLSRWGARVVGVDLSLAVEAARRNLGDHRRVCVAQADIGNLPFREAAFDVIVSIGVLHHTPDTRRSFQALVPLLKPGGTIAIWVYPDEGAYKVRKCWIPFTSRIPPDAFYDWCAWLVPLTQRHPRHPFTWFLRVFFPFSRQGLGIEWDVLDTFDGYSPRFHGTHAPSEVIGWFREAGLGDVREAGPLHTSVRGKRDPGDVDARRGRADTRASGVPA